LEKYFACLLIYESFEDDEKKANINYRIAVVFKNISNYYKALEYCLTALPAMEALDDKVGMSLVYNTLGSIYKYLNDNEKALEYYTKCMELEHNFSEKDVSATTYNNIGIIHYRREDYEKSLKYNFKSLKMKKESNDELGIARSYNNIGVVMIKIGEFDSAFNFFKNSLKIKKGINDKKGQVNTFHNLGDYYFRTGNINLSLKYIDSSIAIAKDANILESVKNNYELLSEIYLEQGQFDSSLVNYKRFSDLKNNLKGPETYTKIAQLEYEYQQKKELKLHELNDQKEQLVNIITIGTLVFVIIFIFLIYRNLRSKYKHDRLKQVNLEMEKNNLLTKIEMKDKELARYIIHLSEKSESLSNIRKMLKDIERKLKEENKPLVRSVINKLNISINNNIWDEFDLRFVNVYNKFYDNLLVKHPDITTNEKRLAAFLKLNMSSKEISMITKQSVHSITVARTRLRKKMGLSNKDVSLISYISTY